MFKYIAFLVSQSTGTSIFTMPVVTAVVVSMFYQWLTMYMPLRSHLITLLVLTSPQNCKILGQAIDLVMTEFGLDSWLFAALYSVHWYLTSRCLGNFLRVRHSIVAWGTRSLKILK
jgi:hypothetical protein